MKEQKQRRQFNQDFKKEAVLLVTEQGYTSSHSAEALSIREKYICRWKKILDDLQKPGSLSDDERDELKQLRREVTRLKMEKKILKKASAFFAKERS